MLINMRNAMLSGGKRTPTAKDYVQDGLVAMWDGIENAGWGTHDPNATVWKDLVGNNDWTNSGATVLNDGFNTKTGLLIKDTASPFPTTLAGADSHTLEIVCSTTKDRGITIISPLSDNSLGFYKRAYRNSFYPYITSSGLSYCNPSSYTLGQMRHFAITYTTYNRGQVTVDGNITVPISTASRYTSYGSKMSIGGVFGQSGADFTINAIRYYSKIPTAAEIAANYAIDKARFNLPDAT